MLCCLAIWSTKILQTPVMEVLFHFHHDLMILLIFVCFFVIFMLGRAVHHFYHERNPVSDGVVHGTVIEIVWTIIPAILLMVVAVPLLLLFFIP